MGEEPVQARVIETYRYSIYRVVKLKPLREFRFNPGQNAEFELSPRICGDCGTKTFSIASSPTEEYIMFATIARDTPFKRALETLKPGDEINIWGPYGHFTLDEKAEEIIMIFHSIGVTPIRSMIIYSADKKLRARIFAIHVDDREDYLFREDLMRASKINSNIRIMWVKSLPEAEELKRSMGDLERAVFYISGPPSRVREITSLLRSIGVKVHRERLKVESFSGY